MRALDDLVRAGMVLYAGISDTPAWIVAQANTLAEERHCTPFVALQVEYSLIERTPERELLPMARAFEMAVTPWSPLGQGILTGKYNRPQAGSEPTRLRDAPERLTERNLTIAGEVVRVAEEIGRTPSQVALAWLRAQPGVILPIVGARRLSQFQENLACLDVTLSADQLQRLDGVSKIELGFPHDYLRDEVIRQRLFGGAYPFIDNPRRRAE
jgi:aryl-alcohol dehydrogenase-like predicted oxidoreductase